LLPDAILATPPDVPVDVVPMCAVCSAFTHDLSRSLVRSMQAGRLKGRRIRVLPPLPEEELAMAMARHVRAELERRKIRTGPEWALLLVAHGTLLHPPRPYETGQRATERLAGRVAEQLKSDFGSTGIAWLNHVFGGEWTRPAADEALADLVKRGVRKVVYFPFGFLADNAESELEGRQFLRGQPSLQAVHLPCLNASPKLARLIARQLAGALPLTAAR
jgi:protoheme ferro-lyase